MAAEMAKLSCLARDKITRTSVKDWKPLMDILLKIGESMMSAFVG